MFLPYVFKVMLPTTLVVHWEWTITPVDKRIMSSLFKSGAFIIHCNGWDTCAIVNCNNRQVAFNFCFCSPLAASLLVSHPGGKLRTELLQAPCNWNGTIRQRYHSGCPPQLSPIGTFVLVPKGNL